MGRVVGRRGFLGATVAATVAACTTAPAGQDEPVAGTRTSRYGNDPSQFGELSRPERDPKAGTVVIIHGGFWQAQYDLSLGRPLAADLVKHGYTCWNLEYRRVGDGGGWPTTLTDVAAGIDHLATLGVDTSAVVAIGHSAGGQLAVWAAGRTAAAPGGEPKVELTGVVSQAGVLDLARAARTGVGNGAPQQLAGGEPDDVPEHYLLADPIQQRPISTPVYCLHSESDANVPYSQSVNYVSVARTKGDLAALHTTEGDHFTLIDPRSAAWTAARDALPALLAGKLPG